MHPFLSRRRASARFRRTKGGPSGNTPWPQHRGTHALNGTAHPDRRRRRATTQPSCAAALTKEELQNLLFDNIGLSKRECREMVNAIFEEMRAALESGESVKLEGFGRFQPKERPKRWARNLRSGERIPVSERRVVTFHPSRKLTDAIGSRPPRAKPRPAADQVRRSLGQHAFARSALDLRRR